MWFRWIMISFTKNTINKVALISWYILLYRSCCLRNMSTCYENVSISNIYVLVSKVSLWAAIQLECLHQISYMGIKLVMTHKIIMLRDNYSTPGQKYNVQVRNINLNIKWITFYVDTRFCYMAYRCVHCACRCMYSCYVCMVCCMHVLYIWYVCKHGWIHI
jgi:hypothetical protein